MVMRKTIRENITGVPYSLHDAEVTRLEMEGKKMTLHFKSGYVQCEEPYDDVDGTVEFTGIDWDCSFACVYKCKEFSLENTGVIEGEKFMLKDFAENFGKHADKEIFEIVDETFGYNQTKLEGYLYRGDNTFECTITIYHMGDMAYLVEE